MTYPAATTLQSIITLAQQQYGIRFQLTTPQLLAFANTCQMIAYNQDMAAFEEWNQKVFFGVDVFGIPLNYVTPLESDIGLPVLSTLQGNISVGTLLNFQTLNRVNHWIIEPLDGETLTLADGDTLSVDSVSGSSMITATNQEFKVSNGPYRAPRAATGNPPFRKFIGITKVTDSQIFGVPSGTSGTAPYDYGIDLNQFSSRKMNIPYRWNETRKEVTLVTNAGPEIIQRPSNAVLGPTTLNDSAYRWVYYINPPTIVSTSTPVLQEDNVIIPEEYRYEVLFKGIEMLADVATYGGMVTVRETIAQNCSRFWEDKGVQFQAFGKANDWISDGDTWAASNSVRTGGNYQSNRFGPSY